MCFFTSHFQKKVGFLTFTILQWYSTTTFLLCSFAFSFDNKLCKDSIFQVCLVKNVIPSRHSSIMKIFTRNSDSVICSIHLKVQFQIFHKLVSNPFKILYTFSSPLPLPTLQEKFYQLPYSFFTLATGNSTIRLTEEYKVCKLHKTKMLNL